MKTTQALIVAALMAGSHQASALINDSKYGDPGELFISVWDEAGAKSFYKDLGISMTDFMEGKSCFQGDFSADPNWSGFGGAQNLVYNIAAVNSLVRDPAGNPVNITKWGYLATSSAGGSIFNASWSAIDNTRQKIQGYIGNLNVSPFTNAPGQAAENKSGVFQATGLGYHGNPSWGASMGRSVSGNTEGTPGKGLEFYFVNNSNGENSGKQVTKMGEWNFNGGKLSYSGTGTSTVCGGGQTGGFTLTVNKSGNGAGTVTSAPAGISCGSTCAYEFAKGTKVTLTAAPDSGSTFSGWSGAGCSGTNTCNVTLNAAASVQANFTVGGGADGSIKLSAPTLWKAKQAQNINWSASGVSDKSLVRVSFSKNGGIKFATLRNVKVTKGLTSWKPTKANATTTGVLKACVKPDPKKNVWVCDEVRGVEVQR